MFIYDGSSVVEGVEIEHHQLSALAQALCAEDTWHKELPSDPERRKIAEANHEAEIEENDYCRECERLAGFILSKFTITAR